MSLSTPILTETWACAVPHASSAANANEPSRFFIHILPVFLIAAAPSDAQIIVKLFDVSVQFAIGERIDHAAIFHDVIAVRNRGGEAEILLDQQDGESLRFQGPDRVADLLD